MIAPRKIAAVSFAAMALLLTGCSAGATAENTKAESSEKAVEAEAPAGQTKDQACDVIEATLVELQGLATVNTTDMNAAVAAFKDAEATVSSAADEISNADVKPAIDGAATAMSEYTVYIESIIADPANADLSAIGEHVAKLQTATAELTTVCA